MKRIIFDIDNTLIIWKNEYLKAIKETIEEYKLNLDYIEVNDLIENYEKKYKRYDKELLLKEINYQYNLNLSIDFINTWLTKLGKMSCYDENVYKILEQLSKKYELVILTNWFKDAQIERLKTAKIDKFFKEIYGGENYIKPSPESFNEAINKTPREECIMVGDDYNIDIIGALKNGIKPIWINRKNETKEHNKEIIEIHNLKEILNIL